MQRLEPLNTDEYEFIERRYRSESKIFMKGMNVMLVLAAIAPMLAALVLSFLNQETKMTKQDLFYTYFLGLGFMIFFVGLIAFISYRVKLWGYYRDRTHRRKIVELANVQQKKFMKMNGTFHFYLSSAEVYTIEVSEQDFNHWNLGDEISVEYSQYAKEYFGYF